MVLKYLADTQYANDPTGKEPVTADWYEMLIWIYGYVKELPSVIPDRPRGEWVTHYDSDTMAGGEFPCGAECSHCGELIETSRRRRIETDFCPYCGADMRGAEE